MAQNVETEQSKEEFSAGDINMNLLKMQLNGIKNHTLSNSHEFNGGSRISQTGNQSQR